MSRLAYIERQLSELKDNVQTFIIDEENNLNKKVEIYQKNFKDMIEAGANHAPIIPVVYDMLIESKYIWQNSAKTYRRIDKKFINSKGERCVKIDSAIYQENEIIGHFFKYDFTW